MRRIAFLLLLAAVACGDGGDPTDPFELAGARFALSAIDGEPLPAHAWDFLGDPVIIDEGTLDFTATRYLALVVRCIEDCATVSDAGTWARTDDTVALMSELGSDLVATFDGATLSYEDYAGRSYLWERR